MLPSLLASSFQLCAFLWRKCHDNLAAMRACQIISLLAYSQSQPPLLAEAPSLLCRPGHLTQSGHVMLNSLMVTSEPNKEHWRTEKWRTRWHFTVSEVGFLQFYLVLYNYYYNDECTSGHFPTSPVIFFTLCFSTLSMRLCCPCAVF